MQNLTIFVFFPLTVCALFAAFHGGLRKRILSVNAVAAAEKRMGGLQRYYWYAFAFVMAAGVFVRCYRFVELPRGINQDGLMAGAEAYSLMMNGTDQFGTSLPTYFEAWGFSQMSTLYSFFLIPFFRLLGVSKFTLRLPMLLVSLAMLPVVWDFARRVLGKGYALITLLLLAVNPWHIIQSRWALEANLMPHLMLLGFYLLYLGKDKRWTLYLSMVFFGLTPYAYGVACFSTSFFLVFAAIFYVARKKAKVWDVLICVLIFICVAGPYFYTMAINAFGWETAYLGPITMPYMEKSLRSRDMAFGQDNPYYVMVWNLLNHFVTWLFSCGSEKHNEIYWAHTLYRFMPPAVLCGMYLIWKDRRKLAARGEEMELRDGGMLILLWFGAALFNGVMIGGVINRNNTVFYPLILMGAYALYQMGKRLRVALVAVIMMLATSFVGLNVTYFTDKSYQNAVGAFFGDGLYDAIVDTWGWDYDQYYVHTVGDEDGAHWKLMNAYIMFAHQVDYRGRNDEIPLRNPAGEEIDWYYSERYVFTDYQSFEPDPMECAVYIIPSGEKKLFNPEEYLITDYSRYAVAYPRYWAE